MGYLLHLQSNYESITKTFQKLTRKRSLLGRFISKYDATCYFVLCSYMHDVLYVLVYVPVYLTCIGCGIVNCHVLIPHPLQPVV